LASLVNDNFRVINGILIHEAVIVKPKHIVLLKKRVLTKIFFVFIKFWRFNSFSIVTSRSKTIAALRLCVLDGNGIVRSQRLLRLQILKNTRYIPTIGGYKKMGQTSQLYKVKNHKYTSGKLGFLQKL
jgi:hypothetical protein